MGDIIQMGQSPQEQYDALLEKQREDPAFPFALLAQAYRYADKKKALTTLTMAQELYDDVIFQSLYNAVRLCVERRPDYGKTLEEKIQELETFFKEPFDLQGFRDHLAALEEDGIDDQLVEMKQDYPKLCAGTFDTEEWEEYVDDIYLLLGDSALVPGDQ